MPFQTDKQYSRHGALLETILAKIDGADLAHELLHIERVYRWALRLAPEAEADSDLAGAAALVHDLVNIPKESTSRSEGGEASALASVPFLADCGYDEAEISDICDAVRTSSWSRGLPPTGPLGRVLQDADRLDAIGAVGIARTFLTAQAMASRGAKLKPYSDTDPLADSGRTPKDKDFALDHFAVKLLKLKEGIQLKSAREEAEKRHDTMLRYLREFKRELG